LAFLQYHVRLSESSHLRINHCSIRCFCVVEKFEIRNETKEGRSLNIMHVVTKLMFERTLINFIASLEKYEERSAVEAVSIK